VRIRRIIISTCDTIFKIGLKEILEFLLKKSTGDETGVMGMTQKPSNSHPSGRAHHLHLKKKTYSHKCAAHAHSFL
jgi:hypothetical protein